MPDLTQIALALQTLLTAEATTLARQTGLVRRRSKLTAARLVRIFVTGFIQHPTASYNLLAQVAAECGVACTPQALQQRLTPALPFWSALLARALTCCPLHPSLPLPLLTQFTRIEVIDSSQVSLPGSLATLFPGPGGDGPLAALKWQVVWELLTGRLERLDAQTVAAADQSYDGYLDLLQAGSLVLFDLGYVALRRLRALTERQVCFLCRWQPRWTAYDAAGQRFDLGGYLSAWRADSIDRTVRVGGKKGLLVRLVGWRLPPSSRAQRRKRARATEQRRGWQYSAAYETLLGWNLYVTNVPPGQLTAEQVSLLYRLRWQIELLFKLWKSQAGWERVAGTTPGRVLGEVYAKLLGLVVFNYLSAPVRLAAEELSVAQAWQVWQRQIGQVGQALGQAGALPAVVARLQALWQQFACKRQRRDRPSTLRRIEQAGQRARGARPRNGVTPFATAA